MKLSGFVNVIKEGKNGESRNMKLGQSSQKEGRVRCVCAMSPHKHVQRWMLIRGNKTSIKDLFWRDRIRDGQMIVRGRNEVRRNGRGSESTQVYVTDWIIPKTPLSAHHCETHAHTHAHGCSDCVHFNSPVTSSYNTRQWLFEQTLVFRSVFLASWQAQARANWLAHHNYRSHLCSHRATANLSTTSPRPTLSKCHPGRAVLQERHPWGKCNLIHSPPLPSSSNEVCCQLYLDAPKTPSLPPYKPLPSSCLRWLRSRVDADDIWAGTVLLPSLVTD